MKTNKLTYSTPIPKVKEYVRNIVSRHNAGIQYPSSLNEVSRLFFKDEKEAKAFIKEWFTEGKDYIISGRKVSLSAKCLRRLFDMASVGLTPNQQENKITSRQPFWKIQCKLPPKTKRFCPLVLK